MEHTLPIKDCCSRPMCQASDRCDKSWSRGDNWSLNMSKMNGAQCRLKTGILGIVPIG